MDKKLEKLKNMGCNIDDALERVLGDEELLLSCIQMVINDPCYTTLAESLAQNNVATAFDAAHTLKGIIANTGLTPLYLIIEKIVEPLRAGHSENLLPYYEKLIAETEIIKQIIE